MKKFSDLNISNDEDEVFVGKKMDMEDVLGQQIEIHDFKILPSKYPDSGYHLCLHMQIKVDNKFYVAFSGSKYLVRTMEKVNKDDLPWETTIKKKDKRFVFS